MSLGYWGYTGPNPFKPMSGLRHANGSLTPEGIFDPRLRAWREAQKKALRAAHKKWAAGLTQAELEALGPKGATFSRFLETLPGRTKTIAADGTLQIAKVSDAARLLVKNPNTWGKFAGHLGENFLYDVAFGAFDTAMETSRTAREFGAKYNDPMAVFIGGNLGFRRARNRNVVAVIGGSIGTALGFVFGGHPIIGNIVGSTIGGKAGEIFDPGLNAQANLELQISRTANVARRVNFGGDFEDTQQAYTMRQQAVQEMSGSLMNARQYLGNEAAFFHGI